MPHSNTQHHTVTGPITELRRELPALRSVLYARAMRLCRCPSRADDLVQQTMLRALRFERQYQPGTHLRAWVGQVMNSLFFTQCRKNKRERRAFDSLFHEPTGLGRGEVTTILPSLSPRLATDLAELPAGYRAAIELVDIGGHSYGQAAKRLGVPTGTIMSRLHRGRKMLAERIKTPRTPRPLAA